VFSVRPSPEVESGLHLEGLLALAVERLSRERQSAWDNAKGRTLEAIRE